MSGRRRGRNSGRSKGEAGEQDAGRSDVEATGQSGSRRQRRSAVRRGPSASGRSRSRRGSRRAPGKWSSRGRWIERTLWIAVVGFLLWRLWPQIAAGLGVPSDTREAPNMSVETLSGREVSLASLRGKVVLVNFWATWCPPCRMEIPGLEAVYRRHHAQGFTIVGLSEDQTGAQGVATYVQRHDVTYPVAMSTGAADNAFGGINVLPTSFLIDRDGRIRYRVQGIFTEPALEEAVQRLLAQKPSGGSVVGSATGAATSGESGVSP